MRDQRPRRPEMICLLSTIEIWLPAVLGVGLALALVLPGSHEASAGRARPFG